MSANDIYLLTFIETKDTKYYLLLLYISSFSILETSLKIIFLKLDRNDTINMRYSIYNIISDIAEFNQQHFNKTQIKTSWGRVFANMDGSGLQPKGILYCWKQIFTFLYTDNGFIAKAAFIFNATLVNTESWIELHAPGIYMYISVIRGICLIESNFIYW